MDLINGIQDEDESADEKSSVEEKKVLEEEKENNGLSTETQKGVNVDVDLTVTEEPEGEQKGESNSKKEEDDEFEDTSVQKLSVKLERTDLSRTTEENGKEIIIDDYNDFRSMTISTYYFKKEDETYVLKCFYTLRTGTAFSVDNTTYVFLFASVPVKHKKNPIVYVS